MSEERKYAYSSLIIITNVALSSLSLSLTSRMKLLTTSRLYRSSAQWRRKLPSLLRLVEAAHYRASPSRQAYLDTSNLKDKVKSLAVAFHSEMRKHGKRTFYVAKQGGTQRVGDSIMKRSKQVDKTPIMSGTDRIEPSLDVVFSEGKKETVHVIYSARQA